MLVFWMKHNLNPNSSIKSKKNFLRSQFNFYNQTQVNTVSPTLISLIIGLVIYSYFRNSLGILILIIISSIGLIIGIFLANSIWKKKGTTNFMSKINASPDFDNLKE